MYQKTGGILMTVKLTVENAVQAKQEIETT